MPQKPSKLPHILFVVLVFALILSILFPQYTFATNAGPNFPSTAVNDTTGCGVCTDWTSPGNAAASDNVYATVNLTSGMTSSYLKATNFGFSIPAGATINGILVEWEVSVAGTDTAKDNAVRIVKGGTIGSTDKSNATDWTTTDTFLSHGSSSDLWGETWTADDINATTFGTALKAALSGGFSSDARIDSVRITVTYTAAPSNSAPSFTAGPSDGGSSFSNPTTVGSNVNFTATATDVDTDNYYLAICKTNAITANNNAAPTCTGGNWCKSGSTASGSESSCSYPTSTADIGSNDWYAFACDHNSSSLCSAMSQGSGNNGSPFKVSGGGGGGGGEGERGQTGTIIVNKSTQGGDGMFEFITAGSGYSNFSIVTKDGSGSNTQINLASGTYSATETVPDGWTKTEDTCNNIVVVAGSTSFCSVKNVKGKPKKGTILVTKKTAGGEGTFEFKVKGQGYKDFSIATKGGSGSNTQANLRPGTYSATETVPDGWIKTEDTCDTIKIEEDKTATCSVTNVKKGTIILIKKTAGGDGTFNFTTSGGNDLPRSLSLTTVGGIKTETFYNAAPGDYGFTEIIPNDWSLSSSSCTTGTPKKFTLSAGSAVTCTFTDSKNNPVPIIESIFPSSKPVNDSEFTLTVNGSNFISSSRVNFNSSGRATIFLSSNKLTALILSSDIKNPGTYSATVINPSPGGGTSNNMVFEVVSGVPSNIIEGGGDSGGGGGGDGNGTGIIKSGGVSVVGGGDVIKGGVVEFIAKIKEIINTPQGSIIIKTISTIGAVIGTLAVASAAISSFSVSDLFLTLVRLISSLLTALGIKKRIAYWGVVYDSVTKRPLDPAYVILKDPNGNSVASAVTDIDGRYGFLVNPGTYNIEAKKTNYEFPSKNLSGKIGDEAYSNIYSGGGIEIKKAGGVLAQNIPLDPLKFDWNEFAKKDKTFMKFYSHWDLLLRKVYDIYFVVGFIVSILAFIFAPYPYNTIILIIYLILLLLRILGLKPKSFGYIIDKTTGSPLSFAILKVMMPSTDTEVSSKVADKYGRYYCLVPKGKYYIKIEKKNEDASYSPVYTSEVIDASKGLIKLNFKV